MINIVSTHTNDNLKSMSILEHFESGILMTVEVPFDFLCKYNYALNIREEFQRHRQVDESNIDTSRSFESDVAVTQSIVDTATNNIATKTSKKKQKVLAENDVEPVRKNRFDDIIERLERKYTTLHTSNPIYIEYNYDDVYSDSESEMDAVSHNKTVSFSCDEIETRKGQKLKRKKRSADLDYYDLDDDFVDDSENAELIETMIKMKFKTKQDGFFVSSSNELIEVLEDDDIDNCNSDEVNSDVNNPGDSSEEDDIVLRQVKRKSASSDEKTIWTPNDSIISALDDFRNYITTIELRPLSKSSNIPMLIYEKLHKLHSMVKLFYAQVDASSSSDQNQNVVYDSSYFSKTTGYFESIADILGGNIPLTKIKRVLSQFDLKDKSKDFRNKIDSNVAIIKSIIPTKIVSSKSVTLSDEKLLSKECKEVPDTEPVSTSESTENQSTFKWRCRWNVTMRSILLEIDQLIDNYVATENKYRSNLIFSELREMPDAEVSALGNDLNSF